MKRKILAVYDVDPFYADRLVEYLSQKERVPFEAMAFTTLERLKAYLRDHHVELLLLGAQDAVQQLRQFSIGQIMLLTEGEAVPLPGEYPSVYKFQSSELIIREMMNYYTSSSVREGPDQEPAHLLGVYSPISRCLKTSLCLAMGQILSRQDPTLYLNLELYAGFEGLLGEDSARDLSDVLYYFKQGGEQEINLEGIVKKVEGLDYIPPIRAPEDMEEMSDKDMAEFIRGLARKAGYKILILDIGSGVRNPIPILELCDMIYMPVKEDGVSLAKLEAFDTHLDYLGKEELKEKIKRLKLPFHMSFGKKENYVEQLIWGELGDYVRNLFRGPLWMSAKRP